MDLKRIRKMIYLYGHDRVFIYSDVNRCKRRIAYVELNLEDKVLFYTELQEAFEWTDFSKSEQDILASDIYKQINLQLKESVRLAERRLHGVDQIWLGK